MNDTHPVIERMFVSMIMSKSGEERLDMGFEMYEFSRKIVQASINAREDSPEFIKELFLRFYGNDVTERVKQGFLSAVGAR